MGLHLPDTPRGRLSAGHYESFMVRIWSRGTSGEVTHGEVIHVGTRRSARFADLQGMLSFIRGALQAPSKQEPPLPEEPPDERHTPGCAHLTAG